MMTKKYSNPSTTLERLSHMSTNEALGVLRYYVITRDIDFNRRPLVQFLNEYHVQHSLSGLYPDGSRGMTLFRTRKSCSCWRHT